MPALDQFEWVRLIRELPLSTAQKCTAYALASYTNGDGSNAHPGVDKLIAATGLSRRSVITALSGLQSQGLITVISEGGRKGVPRGYATVYELSTPCG